MLSPRDAFAICTKDRFHIPPVWDCECGFYSFKELEDAKEYSVFYKGALVVEVEMYGEIIEHDIGYRSREISINKVFVPELCSYKNCVEKSESILVGVKKNGWRCGLHSHKGATSFDQLKCKFQLI